jgi:excisionase family DNA binding protein
MFEQKLSIDALMSDPGRLKEITPETALDCLVRLVGLQSLLLSRALSNGALAQPIRASEDRLLTIPEVAERLAVPVPYAYELARKGELPTVRVGKKYVRVPLLSFEKWLAVQQLDSRSTPAYSARHRRG